MHGWPHESLLDELLRVPRYAFVRWPGTQVIERPGWLQLVTPSFRRGGLNEVALAVLDEHEADAIIDRTIATYRELGLRFRWAVPPDSRPADLAQRLERRGLARSQLLAMARDTSPIAPAQDCDVEIEVVDEQTVHTFSEVMAAGWGNDLSPLEAYNRFMLTQRDRCRLYLARDHGTPAAAAACISFERSLFMLGAVVLPEFRGRGIYRALVAARLEHAAARGLEVATTHAMFNTSGPLLARFGFATIVELPVFHGP